MYHDISLSVTYLEKNVGHGNARRLSFEKCSNRLIAIMDSDDISLPRRFEHQLDCFSAKSSVSIVGGQIIEFIGEPDNMTGVRSVPCSDDKIKSFMKKRCPMNQVSVMLKKDAYDLVGGYLDWYCEEDYFLWLRMAESGFEFANCPEPLLLVRIGDQMSARRGGLKYFGSEERLQRLMLQRRIISLPRYLYNVLIRFVGEVLTPNRLRTHLFKILRKNVDSSVMLENQLAIESNGTDARIYPPFSVAMCVYGGDNAAWFDEAIRSIVEQSVPPDEIVIVVDGPIPVEIQAIIDKWSDTLGGVRLNVIYYKENRGHGRAREASLEHSTHEFVALMDSDDISLPNRFEIELNMFQCDSSLSVVGGQIEEFDENVSKPLSKRQVCLKDYEIKKDMKHRCPINQMSVMMRKSAVFSVGGYQDWFCNEDYYLWIRMAMSGMRFENTPETLVKVRVNNEFYGRRGGLKYFRSEAGIQSLMFSRGLIGPGTFLVNVCKRFTVQLLLPRRLRQAVFRHFARKKCE